MRDNNSSEIARSLYPYGFYKKHTDAGWANKQKKLMQKQADPGLADGYFVTYSGWFAWVEAKRGDYTRFDFAGWNERQREFAVACAWMDIPYWMFLTMGERINGKNYPRVAWLMPGKVYADVETEAYPRKSVSYGTAVARWQTWQLLWAGSGRWEFPEGHPFGQLVLMKKATYEYTTFRD